MKNIVFFFLFISSFSVYSQDVVVLGVKFSLKDSLVVIENLDKKFKSITVTEKELNKLNEPELVMKCEFEGDVVQNYKFVTQKGVVVVEIVSGNKKRKFQIQRPKKQNK